MLTLGNEVPSLTTRAAAAAPPHPRRLQRVVRLRGGLRAPRFWGLHVRSSICKARFGGDGDSYTSSQVARGPARRPFVPRETTGQ